jgi:hypothetical protein
LYTDAGIPKAVLETVGQYRGSGVDLLHTADIFSAVERQFGTLHCGTLDEITQILNNNRRLLGIREAGIGGLTWAFGYSPTAASRLLPLPGSPI